MIFSLFLLVVRVSCYTLGLFCTMWFSSYLGDTYLANLALFSLFSFVFELSWMRPRWCPRYCVCLLVLFLLLVSGIILVQQGISLE